MTINEASAQTKAKAYARHQDLLADKSVDAVMEHFQSESRHFAQFLGDHKISERGNTESALIDVDGKIGHTFKLSGNFQNRRNPPKINSDWHDGDQVLDVSGSGKAASGPVLEKLVAANYPAGGDCTNLAAADYGKTVPEYGPGDQVCWRLRVLFPAKLDTQSLTQAVLSAVRTSFADVVEAEPELAYKGSDAEELAGAPVFRVIGPMLSESVGAAGKSENVKKYQGGVAILMENITPPVSLDSLTARLQRERMTSAFSDTLEPLSLACPV